MPEAIVPYNFVPSPTNSLPSECPPCAGKFHEDRYTGWFEITAESLTPIYTRATKKSGETDNNPSSDFFHYPDGRLALPGSSIRGMIRSLFEIITQSQMEFVSKRRLFFRSFADSRGNLRRLYSDRFKKERLRGGVIERNADGKLCLRVATKTSTNKGFVLISAQHLDAKWGARNKQKRNHFPEFKENIQVSITDRHHRVLEVPIAEEVPKGEEGFLIVPGVDVPGRNGVQRTWFQVILQPDAEYTDFEIPDDVWEDYLAWGSLAHGKRFEKGKDNNAPRRLDVGKPAFALVENDKVTAIGANMMMHLRYNNSINQIVEKDGKLDAATQLDMAQSVFGRVTEKKTGGELDQVRSRVFFEDWLCIRENPEGFYKVGEPETLCDPMSPEKSVILSSPKPTSFQIYLEHQDPTNLQNWDGKDVRIAGRKMYWHRSAQAASAELNLNSKLQDNMAVTLKPLRVGLKFCGRVRFENLSKEELGALYASLELPSGMAHKFGMAKNLGLGSLRLEITAKHLLDMKKRFSSFGGNAGQLSDVEIQEKLKEAYSGLLQFLSGSSQKTASPSSSLWKSTRMRTLAMLLSWSGKPNDEETKQVGFGEQWKYRWTLPYPSRIATPLAFSDVITLFASESTPKPKPEKKPKSEQKVVYREKDKVSGLIIEISSTGLATVELLDGTRVKAQMYGAQQGESYMFRVMKVGGDGKIKEIKR